jgi:putative endonuclease
MSQTFYVYILASRYRGTIYAGASNDISRRVGEHKSGAVRGFTRRYKVKRLVYFEAYGSILEARMRERALKRWRREWKFDLIEKLNPDWHDLTAGVVTVGSDSRASEVTGVPVLRSSAEEALHRARDT